MTASSRTSPKRRRSSTSSRRWTKSLIKVASKMGISTVQSYRGAQIFEAIGLNREVIDKYFTWTASRVGGVGLDVIARESANRHRLRLRMPIPISTANSTPAASINGGGAASSTCTTPNTIAKLQHSVRSGNYRLFKEYTRLVDEHSRNLATLRSLFKFKPNRPPVPIEEVEPAAQIVKRFKTGAMSFGSISKEAHENLAIAMNRIGGKCNTGEGGEDPERFVRDANGDWRRSAIKQVASARFGVTSYYLVNARRAADQDGAGRQARRRRPAARPQGRRLHREDSLLDARRRPDFAAAASRYLLDRGSGAAHPRSEEFQRPRAHQRQAGRRGRRRHDRRRRRQGQGRRGSDQRLRRRHRRVAAHSRSSMPAFRGNSASPRRSRCW